MRRGLAISVLLTLGLGSAAGCRPRVKTNAPATENWQAQAKALEAKVADDPNDAAAWRDLGHIRWIQLGQPDVAKPIFVANVDERGDLPSRLALLVMADARLETAAVVEHAFALVQAAARVPSDDPMRAYANGAAEYAARRIAAVHGDLPGDDKHFSAMFDALSSEIDAGGARLAFSALQPLLSLRAAIARRTGEDYRRFYRRAGCVQSWAVGPMHGHLGALELPAADASGPVTVDPDAVLAQLACVVRLWNPAPSPGVRRMRAELDVPGNVLELEVGFQFPARMYVDGHLVHRTDTTDKFGAERTTVPLSVTPGRHTVDVVTSIPVERAWVMMRATDGHGGPIEAVASPSVTAPSGTAPKPLRKSSPWGNTAGPIKAPLYRPLRALLAAEDALAEGDADRAERQLRALGSAKPFAEGHRMRARYDRADPSRGRTASVNREQKALKAALAADPTLDAARLRLLRIDLERGEDQEVLEALEALEPERLRSLGGEMLRYQVQRRLGSEFAAEEALARAEALNPTSCRVLMARRSIARERDDVRTEDKLAVALATCGGSLSIRAQLAERRGDIKGAIALWDEALARVPDDVDAHETLARLTALSGDHERALTHLRAVLALNPFRVGSHIAMADMAASRGEPEEARQHLRQALEQIPHSNALHRAAATLGIPDDLEQWRADGTAALADYRASGVTYEGVGEVLVLDRSVVRVYPNGGQRQVVHIVAHLLNKEALDTYGEMQIPEGAQLLALHTVKPDGTRMEPEVIGGKEGLSLRHLEIGDVVEYEFVVERGPSGPMPGYVDVSTFRFQSLDVPYHRTELQVIAPASMDLRSDRRNDPPEEILEKRGPLVSHLWRARNVARRGVEPGHRSLLDELPNVHVYTPPALGDYMGSLAVQIREAQRTNAALRGRVRTILSKLPGGPGKAEPRARFMALWHWVVNNIEDRGDLTSPATVTLAERGGSRLMLLLTMLRVADVDAELWLARDAFGTEALKDGHPMFERYDTAVLAVTLPDAAEPLVVLAASEVMPPGYVPPGLRGTSALRLQLDDDAAPSGLVVVPKLESLEDRRQWDLDVSLDPGGDGTVSGTITLTGLEAVFWRQTLRDVDRDRVEELFLQAELGWLRSPTLSSLSIDGEKELDKPLKLQFSATAPGIGLAQDGTLVLRASPMPLNGSARYAGLPRRTTGLVVPYAPEQVANLTYRLGSGKFVTAPDPATVRSKFGWFERKVSGGGPGEDTLTLQIRSVLRPGVVEPAAYSGLAAFAREVDAAEQAVIRAR